MTTDPFNLQRFINAQSSVYEQVLAELKQGRKTSHWMWFIFPQLGGLGSSAISQKFAISSLAEAYAYLEHPILGARLIESTQLVLQINHRSIEEIFGYPDDLKFHSCVTLFAQAAPDNKVFAAALLKFFSDKQDTRTLELLDQP